MYLEYFGFNERPFTITPNPRFIFYSKIHKEAFALLLYGINNHFGFMELTGEVGTGKTTVLRTLLSQFSDETHRIALIFNPSLSSVDLMRAINHEYGIPHAPGNVADLLGELNRFLLTENAAGRTVVLVIDEAQNLAPDVLEQIRLISNLETETDKLIQIVLAGQPELGNVLARPELRQINQRIALRYHLRPLDREDARAYIEHRLQIAGGQGKVSFSPTAIRLIYRYSRGTPRLMNMLCDRALLIGYTENSRKISGRTVTLAFRDVMLKDPPSVSRRILGGAAIFTVLLLAVMFGYQAFSGQKTSAEATSRPESPAVPSVTGTPPSPGSPATVHNDPVELKRALLAELSVRSEVKSAQQAFNALAGLWGAPVVRRFNGTLPVLQEVKRHAGKRNLQMTPFKGSLDDLLRLDSPALISIPVNEGKSDVLVALTGIRNGELLVAPPLLGRASLPKEELHSVWPGGAFILWQNPQALPLSMAKGTRGIHVKRFQTMLRNAGFSDLEADGIYDDATVDAVKKFQASHGLKVTGAVNSFTLIQLYKRFTPNPGQGLREMRKAG